MNTPTPDQYVNQVINRYRVDTGINSLAYSRAAQARTKLSPVIRQWAGQYFLAFTFSGSWAKGTAVSLGTDADFFISLRHSTPETLAEIYNSLYRRMADSGYAPRKQNVSIGITVNGLKIDLLPGRKQPGTTNDHSLYRLKANTWTQTNVGKHILRVRNSGRIREILAMKIWRELHSLDFPSFYLELVTIKALRGHLVLGDRAAKVQSVLEYIAANLNSASFVDPANSNNVISDDLSAFEKRPVMGQASASLRTTNWGEILW